MFYAQKFANVPWKLVMAALSASETESSALAKPSKMGRSDRVFENNILRRRGRIIKTKE